MRRPLVIVAIVLFWAVMTGWLVMRELAPGAFGRLSSGYRGLLSDNVLLADKWMKISMGDRQIGYSHTGIETDEDDAVHRYRIVNETELDITLMGERRQVSVEANASLDAMHHLQRFQFKMKSGRYGMQVWGQRVEEQTFQVRIRTGDQTQRMRIEIPDDAVIYSPMLTMQLRRLKPGQQLRLKTFDPLTFDTTEVRIEAVRTETIRHRGEATPATVLAIHARGMEVLSWIDADGEVLRQETPFGWRLEACSPEEAMARQPDAGDGEDLLFDLAVPVEGSITPAHRREGFRIRLYGTEIEAEALRSHRQDILAQTDQGLRIALRPDRLPETAPPIDRLSGELAPYLESTAYVQADDPAIVAQARRIVADERNSLAAARRIYDWVHANVAKRPTVSVPSAAAVLEIMEGDCNEHTSLYSALARAAGLPTRILVGLTFNEGAFYYHAWPAVYVGRWLEMDPTLGQPAVDATHIKLLEGELENQMKLMTFIGRVRIEVLDD